MDDYGTPVPNYTDENVSTKVVKIIQSYVGVVNKMVWRKRNLRIMKVLVTGAKGFVGKNLCAQLNNIKTGKAKCYGDLVIDEVFEYDLDSTSEQLDQWSRECNFVF